MIKGDAAEALPLVVIFAVKATGFDEATFTVSGENEHAVASGRPEQDIEMLPVNPVPGLTCKEYSAVCPAMTEALVPDCDVGLS